MAPSGLKVADGWTKGNVFTLLSSVCVFGGGGVFMTSLCKTRLLLIVVLPLNRLLLSPRASAAKLLGSSGKRRAERGHRHRLLSGAGRRRHQLRQPQGQESSGPAGGQRRAAAHQELL